MKFGILIIVCLALGALAANYLVADNGYVLINFAGYTVEMSAPVMLLLLIFCYIAVRLTVRIWQAPAQLGEVAAKARAKRANRRITQGYIELAEGNFAKGEKLLTKGIRSSETPLLNYLAAARAAQAQGDTERRDNWLQMAQDQDPEASSAILLTQAELQLRNDETAAARSTLERVIDRSPRSGEAFRLLAEICLKDGDWQTLESLLPKLRKRLGKQQLRDWSVKCYQGLLADAGRSKADIENVWKRVPRNLREDHELLLLRIEATTLAGEHLDAEELIRKALNQQWDSALVKRYGQLHTAEPQVLLKRAEKWLKERPDDPDLLLAAGRLCIRSHLWGKARSYLEASIGGLRPVPEAYNELGQLMLKLKEPDKASAAFRKGLELSWQPSSLPRLKVDAQ